MTTGRTKPDTESGANASSSPPKGFMDDMMLRAKQVAGEKSSSKLRWVAIVAAIAVFAAAAAVGFFLLGGKKSETHVAKPVLTVTTTSVIEKSMPDEVLITGSIWPWDPTQIACEIGNLRVQTVTVEEGATVHRGQVLATLNSSVLRAQLAQARAHLAANEAALIKARQPNRQQDIAGLRAALAQARANIERSKAALVQAKHNFKNLRDNADRAISLAQQGAISSQEAETRDTQAKVAHAEIGSAEQGVEASDFVAKQAKEKLDMAEVGGRAEDILMAQAQVAEQRAEVERLSSLIAQTIITAPDDGLITRRLTHVGDTPQVGAVLFRMARQGKLEMRAAVPERDLLKAAPGMKVQLQRADGKMIEGTVTLVVPEVDPDTRLGMLRVAVPADQGLVAGMFCKGSLLLPEHPAIVVPGDAVIARDSRYFVFILSGDKVVRTAVTIGARTNEQVEITSGLQPGQKVVLAGAAFLKDGDMVRVADALPLTPLGLDKQIAAPQSSPKQESR